MILFNFYRILLTIAHALSLFSIPILFNSEELITRKIGYKQYFLNLLLFIVGVSTIIFFIHIYSEKFAFLIKMCYIIVAGVVVLHNLFTAIMKWLGEKLEEMK